MSDVIIQIALLVLSATFVALAFVLRKTRLGFENRSARNTSFLLRLFKKR